MVHSMFSQLFLGHMDAVLEGEGVSRPKRQVTGSILVVQGCEVENATFGDRRMIRHQSHFAEICCAFVHCEQRSQRFIADFSGKVSYFTILQRKREAVNNVAAVTERLGAADLAARAGL
ncbi:hypothetical protein D3C76_1521000 [compost metagenome]